MSKLVMGTSIGYEPEHLEPFAKSLRRHYDGHIAMIVKEITEPLQKFFEQYNIQAFEVRNDYDHDQICNLRHQFHREVLKNHFLDADRILLTDTRDVVFQANPFGHEITTELEFFLESSQYKNNECNTWWLKGNYAGAYGEAVFNQLCDEYIICAGTTMGTREGIIKYLDTMIVELNRILVERKVYVTDQPSHGYLIYNNHFPSNTKYYTGRGPISTMNDYHSMKFDSDNNLLNDDGSITPIIHQWDRTGDKKEIFYKKAMGLI